MSCRDQAWRDVRVVDSEGKGGALHRQGLALQAHNGLPVCVCTGQALRPSVQTIRSTPVFVRSESLNQWRGHEAAPNRNRLVRRATASAGRTNQGEIACA